jgi:hypothetical protein
MDRLWAITTFDYTRGDNPSARLSSHQRLHRQQCLWAGSRYPGQVDLTVCASRHFYGKAVIRQLDLLCRHSRRPDLQGI